jgi:hypothetical protein
MLTYVVLYKREIHSLSLRQASRFAPTWLGILHASLICFLQFLQVSLIFCLYGLAVAAFLGFWAGIGYGLYRLYTGSLSTEAKTGISIAIFAPCLIALAVYPIMQWRRAVDCELEKAWWRYQAEV